MGGGSDLWAGGSDLCEGSDLWVEGVICGLGTSTGGSDLCDDRTRGVICKARQGSDLWVEGVICGRGSDLCPGE